jgi:hypothetical protein
VDPADRGCDRGDIPQFQGNLAMIFSRLQRRRAAPTCRVREEAREPGFLSVLCMDRLIPNTTHKAISL